MNSIGMKDEDQNLPVTSSNKKHTGSVDASLFGKGKYKFWAFAAILLLAFWSMFTGTVSLRWSAGNLNRISSEDDVVSISDDLDVLEREKMVERMWDVYTHGHLRLPRFWQDAFEAAYEDLTSDDPTLRDAAVSEIARMSIHSPNDIQFQPSPLLSGNARAIDRSIKETDKVS